MSHCSGLHFIVEKWKKFGKMMPKLEKYIEWDFFWKKSFFGENIFAKCFPWMLGCLENIRLANFLKLQQSGLKAVPDFLRQAFKNSHLVSFLKLTLPTMLANAEHFD
ncbi:Phosphoglycerate kinase [Trichinella pseudospiralis]